MCVWGEGGLFKFKTEQENYMFKYLIYIIY